MAESVVDDLEIVQVEEQHGDLVLPTQDAGHRILQPIAEHAQRNAGSVEWPYTRRLHHCNPTSGHEQRVGQQGAQPDVPLDPIFDGSLRLSGWWPPQRVYAIEATLATLIRRRWLTAARPGRRRRARSLDTAITFTSAGVSDPASTGELSGARLLQL